MDQKIFREELLAIIINGLTGKIDLDERTKNSVDTHLWAVLHPIEGNEKVEMRTSIVKEFSRKVHKLNNAFMHYYDLEEDSNE